MLFFCFSAGVSKLRWAILPGSFVKSRKKNTASGSVGGTQREWKYAEIMSFLLPHLQKRRFVSTFQHVYFNHSTSIVTNIIALVNA